MNNIKIYTIYITLFLLIGSLIVDKNTDTYLISTQLFFALISFIYICQYKKINSKSKIFVCTFIFQLLLATILRIEFQVFDNSFFGPFANDSLFYFKNAIRYSQISYYNFIKILDLNIDDMGFYCFLKTLAQYLDYGTLANLTIILNALFIALSSIKLYDTFILINKYKKTEASFVTALFSSNLFFVCISSYGLKEDLFIFILIYSLYYMIKFQRERNLTNLLCFLFWVSLSLFFRTSITAIYLLSFLTIISSNQANGKLIKYSLIISLFIFPILIKYILPNVFSISYEEFVQSTANRLNDHSNASLVRIANALAAIIGPFPTFAHYSEALPYSFSLYIKMLYSIPILHTAYKILKNNNFGFYNLVAIYIMGLIFFIVTERAMDMRFQLPFLPAFYMLIYFFYIRKFNHSKIYKHNSIIFMFTIAIIFLFNIKK